MHDGHRKRMKERFYRDGNFENFAQHEILEMLLYSTIARGDTNPIGHALIEKFGSLANVLEASPDELKQVKGIGESSAFLLSMLPHLCQAYQRYKWDYRVPLSTADIAGQYAISLFIGKKDEEFRMICLDSNRRVFYEGIVAKGTINEVQAYPRVVVAEALKRNARFVIFAHNHPNGMTKPSEADIKTTNLLRDALEKVEVLLQDHIIVSGHSYFSMADAGMV